MYNIRNLIDIILVSIIVVLLLSNGCNNTEEPTYIKGKDSIVIKETHTVDSFPYPVPYKVLRVDTVRDTIPLAALDSIRLYENYNRDSSVLVQSEVRGLLLGAIIHAKLKTEYIYRTDTFKLPSVTKTSLRPLVFAVADTSRVTGGLGAIYTGRKSTFVGGYNFVNKSVLLGVGIKIGK